MMTDERTPNEQDRPKPLPLDSVRQMVSALDHLANGGDPDSAKLMLAGTHGKTYSATHSELSPDQRMRIAAAMKEENPKKQRPMMLPPPPKGFPKVPSRLAFGGAEFERMMLRDRESLFTQFTYQEFTALPEGDQILTHWEIAGVQRWLQHGKRVFYPTVEITQACKNTDALKTVTGRDVLVSHPSFLMVVPEGEEWDNGRGSTVTSVVVNIMENEPIDILFAKECRTAMHMPNARFLTLSIYWSDDGVQSMCIPLVDDCLIADSFSKYSKEHIDSVSDDFIEPEEQEVDTSVGFEIGNFVMNTLLVMQSYPEYITTVEKRMRRLDEKKVKGRIKISTIATPTNLRQQVPHTPPKIGDPKSSILKRKTHIRRGHWRRQRHKPEWEMDNPDKLVVIMPDGGHAHMVWIQPLLIQSQQEDDE
jgi:hypothetical protein